MENRSNYLIVGVSVIALLIATVAVILWLSRIGGGDTRPYDIFFKTSVSGLATGSGVTFAGVPVGEVKQIELLPESPEFVRVRIAVKGDVPILQGTTATIAGVGFTGVSQINLEGAIKGAPPISQPGPEGVPVIPTKPGALGELLSNAPQLLDRLTTLTERLTQLLSDRNQASIAGILENTQRISNAMAERSPEIAATLAEARTAIREAGTAAKSFGELAATTNTLLDEQGRPMMTNLNASIAQANRTLATIDATVAEAQPGIQAFSKQTVPQIGQLVVELKRMSESLGAVAAKLDENPTSALLGGRKLPDYEPAK
jgi:phospholipid/cholesterol/gamma-HCH transport system substrate-binding protein